MGIPEAYILRKGAECMYIHVFDGAHIYLNGHRQVCITKGGSFKLQGLGTLYCRMGTVSSLVGVLKGAESYLEPV